MIKNGAVILQPEYYPKEYQLDGKVTKEHLIKQLKNIYISLYCIVGAGPGGALLGYLLAFGINCALLDADVLADVIIEALDKQDVSAAQLRKLEHVRRADIEELQKQQFVKEETYQENFIVPVLA